MNVQLLKFGTVGVLSLRHPALSVSGKRVVLRMLGSPSLSHPRLSFVYLSHQMLMTAPPPFS